MEKTANILGALSLALADGFRSAVADVLGIEGETGAAIIMIGAHPGMSVGQVATALRLTQSGSTRVIDRLTADGLVMRSQSPDNRRIVLLELTEKGHQLRKLALKQREGVLERAVSPLTDTENAELEGLLHKVLGGLLNKRDGQCYQICRMCDESVCVPNGCPIEERWAELFGAENRHQLP
ncbi:MarR family winged helix-turn-helix transcriptional regulator [Aureimonas sp. N4]|uniref:MarR family winged helix-turn-helix transcriptional regulator n=1 Tax=Aureimonas sp. N4 TaxID=1638165 RepID=UPI0007847AF1|nr:MarR family transcriptional regulator [Aureimonas sp. N4]